MSDVELTDIVADVPKTSRRRLLLSRLRLYARNPGALIGGVIMLAILLIVVIGPALITTDPNAFGTQPLAGISLTHPMGTDQYGRDILIRVIVGGRSTIFAALIGVAIGGIIGSVAGMIAGYIAGWVDPILMVITDILLAFPGLILILMVVAILGPGPLNVQIAVGISLIPVYIRMMRATVLELRSQLYVEAARALGCSSLRIMWQHLLPNLVLPLLVLTSTALGWAIASGAAVSYLGLGVQLPNADWGLDLAQAVNYVSVAWWEMFPGLLIMISILAVNLIGDGLQLALDPKLRRHL